MDYIEIYQKLFHSISNHKDKEFVSILSSIEQDDIMFDINTRDDKNNYFLTYAIGQNKANLVKEIIKRGGLIDISDKHDKPVIFIAIKYSYIDIIKILLNANEENIGISILDMRDRTLKTALHYAITIGNFEVIKLLLDSNANPNVHEKEGYNALHLAVKSRSLKIVELVLSHIADVNAKCNTGETSLHIACNLQLIEIISLLMKHKANVDVVDYSHEISPLHYSVLLNNKELIAILLKNNANPNVQDIYGNTPLHYAIIENNFEIFIILTQSSSTKMIINMNMWNVDGEIPLHIVMKNNIENITDFLDILMPKSNLSLQDNDGNTCLHYLIKLGLWKMYRGQLSTRRLDIFSKNSASIAPIDMIINGGEKNNDVDEFVELIVDSYFNRLKKANEYWQTEWENICKKDFTELSDEDAKKLEGVKKSQKLSNETFIPVCKSIINAKILDLINKHKKGEQIDCTEKSFPITRASLCVNATEGSKLDYCTFTGSTLDILIGLIYLLKKHRNCCSTLTKNYAENKELCSFYKSIGILMNSKCEFLNFEIVWVHQRLYLMDGFYDQFKLCLKSGKRFVIIPLGIEIREGSHAGYIIYDKTKNEVERFEPHGSSNPPGLYYNPALLDEMLEARFKLIDENIKYIPPKDYLPKIGFQLFDVAENKKKRIGDPVGFCALWCIWYVDMKLTYADADRKELVQGLIRSLRSNGTSFKNMIRNYGKQIIDIRDSILKNSQLDINDWLNDQYTDVQIGTVISKIAEMIDGIAK